MKLDVKSIAAIGIGTALFFLLARFVSIPVFANTTITFQYALLAFFAVLFGPIVGAVIGITGHLLSDMSWGWGVWWSWIVTSGVVGFGLGYVLKGVPIETGSFNKRAIVRFVIGSSLVNLVAWGGVAPILDILIYAQAANFVFTQGLIAGVGNIIGTAVVGSLLLFAYSKTKAGEGSLVEEQ